jgi:hypothetical protein
MLCFGLLIDEVKHYYTLMSVFTSFSMAKLYGMDKNYLTYPALTVLYYHFGKQLEEIFINNYRINSKTK